MVTFVAADIQSLYDNKCVKNTHTHTYTHIYIYIYTTHF